VENLLLRPAQEHPACASTLWFLVRSGPMRGELCMARRNKPCFGHAHCFE